MSYAQSNNTDLPVQENEKQWILFCPRRQLDVMYTLSCILLYTEVEIGIVLEEPELF